MEKINRCPWCGDDSLYTTYHDEEWGKPIYDDKRLFEFLILESAQAGLSWITILRRRDGYRKLFADFEVTRVASFTDADVERLLLDPSIIRHRGKIVAAIRNAQLFIQIQKEFGSFYTYLYSFMPDQSAIQHNVQSMAEVPTRSKESDAIAKDMKRRGFKFFGTTICYAYMQAVGMINDHLNSCAFK